MHFFQLLTYLSIILFTISCNEPKQDLGSSRSFEFTYQVTLEPSSDKVELWFPIPQTTAVQKISNPILDSGALFCEELVESVLFIMIHPGTHSRL